ncbi:MAG: hypothetical protein OHK0045_19190 [Raineya sp.]
MLLLLGGAYAYGQDTLIVVEDTFQRYRLHKLWEVGISANAYKGDLAQSYALWSSSLHIGLKFAKKKRWNAHLNTSIGSVRGQNYAYEFDANATPNLFFRSNIITVQVDLQYNFVRNTHWIAYISQGVGIMRFMPKNERGENLQNLLTSRAVGELYGNVSALLPSSIGILYLLKNGYVLGFQVSLLRPTTDYLDNISVWGKKNGSDKIMLCKWHIAVPTWKIRKFFAQEEKKEKISSR